MHRALPLIPQRPDRAGPGSSARFPLEPRLSSDENVVPIEVFTHPRLDSAHVEVLDAEIGPQQPLVEQALGQIRSRLSREGSAANKTGRRCSRPTFPTLSTRSGPAAEVAP